MTHYLLFGGKGGVGKTTCAAATALRMAKNDYKTLIVSTDPAHSLSDSFEKKISSTETKISENLYAVEIDPAENVEKLKAELSQDHLTPEENPLAGMGMDMGDLTGGLGDLGSMPGMDEMAAFNKFLQYVDNQDYDNVVFDTAPTGHTLKFLSLPEIMDSWVGKMLRLRIQMSSAMKMFKQILPFSDPGEKDKSMDHLEKMKAQIEKGREVLTNPNLTTFTLVTIPQEMAIAESERAVKQIENFGITIKKIIVNQTQPKQKDCKFCTMRRKLHDEKLASIKKKFKGKDIVEVPLEAHEVKGLKSLTKFAEKLF